MKIAIYSRGLEQEDAVDFYTLLDALRRNNVHIVLYTILMKQFQNLLETTVIDSFETSADLNDSFDALISLGGDGTILDAVTLIRDKQIPIIGINFGRLGFLAGISRDEINTAIDALVQKDYVIDQRGLIHVESDHDIFGNVPFGLNDFAILKKDTAPMIKIHTFLNGELLNIYWADGLIVSTPTGSTAYNLSCNGPILFPDAQCFVITPIAPHQLNVRPIIIPNDKELSFEVESRADQYICSLDARREMVDTNTRIRLRQESFKIKIIRQRGTTFLTTMRNKLGWGLDKRN